MENHTVALYGSVDEPAVRHDLAGGVLHGSIPGKPLVHMVSWAEERVEVEVSGNVVVAGDAATPLFAEVRHEFVGDHHQTLSVDPLAHSLTVSTAIAEPIHHALQMRTPLDVRFCNEWHVASDYVMEITLGQSRVIGVRLTGATVATPQPCEDDCPPAQRERTHS